MHAQLRLTPDGGDAPTLRVEVGGGLARLFDRLEPTARQELEARLPLALRQLFDTIAAVRSLPPDDLALRLVMARRDVARYEAEMVRRGLALPAG